MYKVRVYVSYKASVLNPQAEVLEGTMHRLGYEGVSEVKMGKYFDITIEAETREVVEQIVDELCDKLLANITMETYYYEIKEAE